MSPKPHQNSHMISTSLILFVTTTYNLQHHYQNKLCDAHKVSHVLFLPPKPFTLSLTHTARKSKGLRFHTAKKTRPIIGSFLPSFLPSFSITSYLQNPWEEKHIIATKWKCFITPTHTTISHPTNPLLSFLDSLLIQPL